MGVDRRAFIRVLAFGGKLIAEPPTGEHCLTLMGVDRRAFIRVLAFGGKLIAEPPTGEHCLTLDLFVDS
jgi:hypothetical protein